MHEVERGDCYCRGCNSIHDLKVEGDLPIPVPLQPDPQPHNDQIHFQIMTGPPFIKVGYVGIVLRNLPIAEIDGELVPCVQLTARQAMEIAMNMIHISKIAEEYEKTQ